MASVIKGDLVRLDEIPLMMHVPGLGVHARGTKLVLAIADFDELMIEASCRVVQVLDAPAATNEALEEANEEAVEGALEEAQEEVQEGDPDGANAEGDIATDADADADAGATALEPLQGGHGGDAPRASSGDGINAADGALGASTVSVASGAWDSSADEPVAQA